MPIVVDTIHQWVQSQNYGYRRKRGPKTRKGRTRYHGAWREPKLCIIYVVDEEGRQHRQFAPLIDGVLNGPDALFSLLACYLQELEVLAADQLLFISDGVTWIWNRIPALLETLGIGSKKVHFLIDFFHAVEHIGRVAALRKDWSSQIRKRWFNRQRRLLHQGQVGLVINAIRSLC